MAIFEPVLAKSMGTPPWEESKALDVDEVYNAEDLSSEQMEALIKYDLRPQDLDGEQTIRQLLPDNPSVHDFEGWHWLFASNSNRETREFQISREIIPDSDNEAVRRIDEEAYEKKQFKGKWNVFRPADKIDSLWDCVKDLIASGDIGLAKVSTKWSREQRKQDDHVVIVYTDNYMDRDDVFRVRELLRNHCGVNETLYYKPDIYTSKNIYADTAAEMGLPGASRYSG